MSTLIRKITLNMLCFVPCCEVQQIFLVWLSKETRSATKTFNLIEASSENAILQNHCSDNVEPNSKDNSEYAPLRFLLRGSTDFFFGSPKGYVQQSKLSIRNKLAAKMMFCRIIGVIMPNLIQKIILNMRCSLPCCEVQQIFFFGSPREQVKLSKH